MQEKGKLLKPKIDIVFHSLFKQGNEDITKALISATTNEEIKSIKLEDRHILGSFPYEKLGIVDLKATLDNGTICDIEIQLVPQNHSVERFLYYWSRIYSSQLEKGNKYQVLNKVIGIIILDYNLNITKEIESLSTKWRIKEVNTGKNIELTDALELYIIEIPKAKKLLEKEPNNKLAQWIMFLNDPNESEVSEIMKTNKEIEEAMEQLERISQDKELIRIIELRRKAILDENSRIAEHEEREEKIKKYEEDVKKHEEEVKKQEENVKKHEEEVKKQEEDIKKYVEDIKNQKENIKKNEENIQKEKDNIKKQEKNIKKQEEKLKIEKEKYEKEKEKNKKEESIKIARNLLNLKLKIADIVSATGLTYEEIEEISK